MEGLKNNRLTSLINNYKKDKLFKDNEINKLLNFSGLLKILCLCEDIQILDIEVNNENINVNTSYSNGSNQIFHTFNLDSSRCSNYFDKKFIINALSKEEPTQLSMFNSVVTKHSTSKIFSLNEAKINDYNNIADEMYMALNVDKLMSSKSNQSLQNMEDIVLNNLDLLSNVHVNYQFDCNHENTTSQTNAVNEIIKNTIEDVKECEFLNNVDNIM